MRQAFLFAAAGAMGFLLTACQPNPLASSAGVPLPPMAYAGVQEVNDGAVIFSPNSMTVTDPLFPSGSIGVGSGGASKVYAGPSTSGSPNGTYGNGSTPLILGPAAWLCPTGNCKDVPSYRGLGGLNGDFSNDYFIRYAGVKGPDPSNDYSSLQVRFSSAGATEYDIRGYRGIVFWARGHGDFAVNLVARKPNDFISPAYPAPGLGVPPYSDWNFYLHRFGSELNGDEQWKQIVVYFTDMVQEYGLAVDLDKVKAAATGLQFDQQSPYTKNFQLDIDYIRLFK